MENLGKHIKGINKEFVDTYFASYMLGEWGVEVGYNYVPISIISAKKEIADWQLSSDCTNELCIASKNQTVNIFAYPKWGGSPFPQIDGTEACRPFSNISQNVNIQNVQVVISPLSIQQFIVGNIEGPLSGTFVFIPLDVTTGLPLLKGKSIDLSLSGYGPLALGINYNFDTTTGTITLLAINGMQTLFNEGEVYTIIIY